VKRRDFLKITAGAFGFPALPSVLQNADSILPWPIAHRSEQRQAMSAQYLVDVMLKPQYPNVRVATAVSKPLHYQKQDNNTMIIDSARAQPNMESLWLCANEEISIASMYKVPLTLIAMLILNPDEYSGMIGEMLQKSDNALAAQLIMDIYTKYSTSDGYRGENPIELINNLVYSLLEAVKSAHPELNYDPDSNRFGIYKWDLTPLTEYKDERLKSNEYTGPRLPISFITSLMSDVILGTGSLAISPVIESFVGSIPENIRPTYPLVSMARFVTIMGSGDVMILSPDDDWRAEAIKTWENDVHIAVKTSKYGRVNGVVNQMLTLEVINGADVTSVTVVVAVEDPDQYNVELSSDTAIMFENTAKAFLFQYMYQVLTAVLDEGTLDSLRLFETSLPWGEVRSSMLVPGINQIRFTPNLDGRSLHLVGPTRYATANGEDSYQIPFERRGLVLTGCQTTGITSSNGGVLFRRTINVPDREPNYEIISQPLKTSPYTYKRFQGIPILRENMAFVLDPEIIDEASLPKDEFISDPKGFIEKQLKEFLQSIGYRNISNLIANFLASIEEVPCTQIINIQVPDVTDTNSCLLLILLAMYPDTSVSKMFAKSLVFNASLRAEKGVLTAQDWLQMHDAIDSIGGYLSIRKGLGNPSSTLESLVGTDQPMQVRGLEWGGRYLLYYFATDYISRVGTISMPSFDLLQLELSMNATDWNRLRGESIKYHEVVYLGGFEAAPFTGTLLVLPDQDGEEVIMVYFYVKTMGEIVRAILARYPDPRIFIPDMNFMQTIVDIGTRYGLEADSVVRPSALRASPDLPMPVYVSEGTE